MISESFISLLSAFAFAATVAHADEFAMNFDGKRSIHPSA